MKSKFTRIVGFKPLPDGRRWVLLEDLTYYRVYFSEAGIGMLPVTAPKGFITDFASVPKPFQCFVGRWGKHGNAAVIHDWLYHTQIKPRKEADKIFLDAMEVLGVGRIKRYVIYYSVRLFGWWAWLNDKKGAVDLKKFKKAKVTEW